MANIGEASDNFSALTAQLQTALAALIQSQRGTVEDYITDQLYSGKDGNERDLSPNYLNDPYFNKYGKRRDRAARGYINWKMRITPPVRSWLGFEPRKAIVPNLYINGYYHSKIRANAVTKGVRIEGTASFSAEIENKYGRDIYKVSPTAVAHFIKEYAAPFLTRALNPRGYELRL